MLLAQLSDTHVTRAEATYFGIDTTRYLRDAIDALHDLAPRPDLVVVTGDLVCGGHDDEYERFAGAMATLRIPYVAVPGNHDDRDRMRARLPPQTYGESMESRVRFVRDVRGVRLIGLDPNGRPSFPRPSFDRTSLAWFERTLAERPAMPTIVCLHQPPFRTGLHYLDAFGFGGAERFRRAVRAHPNVGRVISGHIHCTRSAYLGTALAITAPSTAPQMVPELFERRVCGLRRERPGFALHGWDAARGFETTIYRRDDAGRYVPDRATSAAWPSRASRSA
jgi:3',5'-cyclic AMP phosphodiesterase CpdA